MGAPWTYGNGECELCGHYATEGIVEGVCKDCREAYADDYPDEDATDCRVCQGTGIGRHGDPDTSRCSACHGRGYLIPQKERDL